MIWEHECAQHLISKRYLVYNVDVSACWWKWRKFWVTSARGRMIQNKFDIQPLILEMLSQSFGQWQILAWWWYYRKSQGVTKIIFWGRYFKMIHLSEEDWFLCPLRLHRCLMGRLEMPQWIFIFPIKWTKYEMCALAFFQCYTLLYMYMMEGGKVTAQAFSAVDCKLPCCRGPLICVLWLSLLAVALLSGDCGGECTLEAEGQRVGRLSLWHCQKIHSSK